MADVDPEAAVNVLYDEVTASRTWLYRDPNGSDDTVFVAVANVSRLVDGLSMEHFLGDMAASCGTITGCELLEENSSSRSPVLYNRECYPAGRTDEVQSLVHTFRTLSPQSLQEFATRFVENASDLRSSPPGSPTPRRWLKPQPLRMGRDDRQAPGRR